MDDIDEKNETRFWSYVTVGPGCWEWQGERTDKDYGRFKLRGQWVRAHRLVYELLVGPIPPGLKVCHHCDNPPCCRPNHLFAGTSGQNTQDMLAKGRATYAKLTPEQVLNIRREHAAGATQRALAEEYGVSNVMIHYIVKRKWWKDV